MALQPCAQLGGDGERIARIALYERFAQRFLGFAVIVYISGIEVSLPGRHKDVHHLLNLLQIRFAVFQLRKAHKAEPQLRGFLSEIVSHIHFSLSCADVIPG